MATAKGKAKAKAKAGKEEVKFGVHSEVGQLRKVMVCAPGRAHARLTPSNCDALLFDDVLWVENAKRGETYEVRPEERRRDLVLATLAVAYTLFMIYAGGLKFILLSAILFGPGTILYYIARRE